jgi:hypothetical protein
MFGCFKFHDFSSLHRQQGVVDFVNLKSIARSAVFVSSTGTFKGDEITLTRQSFPGTMKVELSGGKTFLSAQINYLKAMRCRI